MRSVRILADYYCFALWVSGESGYENIAPSTQELGLSEPLARDLDHWAAEYSATLRDDDPVNSGFQSEAAENDFYARGYQLALRVKRELGEFWQVSYFDGVLRRDVQIVNELDAFTSPSGGPMPSPTRGGRKARPTSRLAEHARGFVRVQIVPD